MRESDYLIKELEVVYHPYKNNDIEQKVTNYQEMMKDLNKAELFKALKEMREKGIIKKR